MLGLLQTARLKLEVRALAPVIAEHLTQVALIRQWAWPQEYPGAIGRLIVGGEFTSYLGLLSIGHRVTRCDEGHLEMLLWGAVDGLSYWQWGNGWLEQTTTGVTLIPLIPAQQQLLKQLQHFLDSRQSLLPASTRYTTK